MIKVNENFKIDLKTYGRQFDVKLKANDVDINSDDLNYVKPSFNSTLFKTIMHQIEIDSNTYIPVKTKITGKIGVKLNEKKYNYIDLNTYYVKSCERQEDTNSYRVLAYTKMQEAMVESKLNLSEKLTVRNYIIKICNKLNWDTTNIPKSFINSDKLLDPTLHTGIGYTYRDILDEIATVTCSFLLFKGENLYLIYPTETNETIDETYLDEDNITIGEPFFINSLVFARAEESDNIYRKDDESIQEKGLHEFRISDNQLLSTNDRDLYIDEMFNYLKTLNFYTFDVQSKGILFLEACDIFNFVLSNTTYKTILLNNEIDLEDGLTEKLYTDKPEETETEYKYADTTDKKINKTYILVDKQNKKITQLTSEINEHEEKIAQVEQDVDGITQKVENMADTTRSVKGLTTIKLEKCIKGYLIKLRILGNNAVFKRLYPADNLYPSDTLYPLGDSRIIVTDADGNSKMYELRVPDVLRANDEAQDEYILENNFAKVIRKVNEDGTTKEIPVEEEIGKYAIYVAQGDNTITIQNYNANIEAVFVQQNAYTDQFATKVEMTSAIQQNAEQIQTKVNKTLKENYSTTQEMESTITQTAEEINTEVKKKVGENEIISKINQSAETVTIQASKISLNGKVLNLADNMSIESNNFKVDSKGNMTCSNATITGGTLYVDSNSDDNIIAINNISNSMSHVLVYSDSIGGGITVGGSAANDITIRGGIDRHITCRGYMEATAYNYVSDAKLKEKIKPYKGNALNIINKAQIYDYVFTENKRKEFGMVIGEKYDYPEEIVDKNEDVYSINAYRMSSVMWKAIQELNEKINILEKRLEKYENG